MNGRDKMFDYISSFSRQLKVGFDIGRKAEIPAGEFKSVLICGMGGSAIGGDLLLGYAKPQMNIPFAVNRGYNLPGWVNQDTLTIFSSYSGNTGETLSCFSESRRAGPPSIAITSGGELGKLCSEKGVSCATIPGGLPPRAALGYSFAALFTIFQRMGFINPAEGETAETVGLMEKLTVDFSRSDSEPADLASRLKGKIPVFYTDGFRLESIVTRCRCQFAENAKTLSFSNVFPELNHNEIVGWGGPGFTRENLSAVFIQDRDSSPEVKLQTRVMKEIISELGVSVYDINSQGESFLARMMSLVHFGDWLSWHLARLLGVDPLPIERIDLLKRKLSEARL